MTKIKAGDVVHLTHDSQTLFTVTDDTQYMGHEGKVEITRMNGNTTVQLNVHTDSFGFMGFIYYICVLREWPYF